MKEKERKRGAERSRGEEREVEIKELIITGAANAKVSPSSFDCPSSVGTRVCL